MTAPTLAEAPAGAPALAPAPGCETVHIHGLTGATVECERPAEVADLVSRTCGCAPVAWAYTCGPCVAEGARVGYACMWCWDRTVRVLCRVPVGRG